MEASIVSEPTAGPDTPPTSKGEAKFINVALQGGGAHGAFTWGVLDRLLEDERIAIDGISATSAGAMNATLFASGIATGGREGAKKALTEFWRRISHAALTSLLRPTFLECLLGNHSIAQSAGFVFFEVMTRLFSPYEFNPPSWNPLRQALLDSIDFDALSPTACPIKLYLTATNVRTGKIKVFDNSEIGVDAVLASACLPFLFQAVEIDGEAYWDGGYAGNPPIFPLIYNCSSSDVLIVQLSPMRRDELPHGSLEILNRVNEISFNSSLLREMRAIHFVTRLIDDGTVVNKSLRRMRIHTIAADDAVSKLSVASKLETDWDFLASLRDTGRRRAEQWLDAHFDRLGVESTVISRLPTCDRHQSGARPIVFAGVRASEGDAAGEPLPGHPQPN
jgi:NTE family protein